jgi:hypothetical protein
VYRGLLEVRECAAAAAATANEVLDCAVMEAATAVHEALQTAAPPEPVVHASVHVPAPLEPLLLRLLPLLLLLRLTGQFPLCGEYIVAPAAPDARLSVVSAAVVAVPVPHEAAGAHDAQEEGRWACM